MTALRALGATGTLPTKRYPIESEAPNRGPLFMSPKPLRAAHLFPIDPMTVLAPSQHQEGERAAEAQAEAAARPLVSCKALVYVPPGQMPPISSRRHFVYSGAI